MKWSGQSRIGIKKLRNELSFGLKRKHVIQNVNWEQFQNEKDFFGKVYFC